MNTFEEPAEADQILELETPAGGPKKRRKSRRGADGSTPQQRVGRMGAALQWAGLLVIGGLTLAPVIETASREFSRYLLVQADATAVATKLAAPASSRTPDEQEVLSELALLLDPANADQAMAAAKDAVTLDADRPFVWARIAWLESEKAHGVNAASLDALKRSMELCPLCDQSLVRWRFNFVLAHWNATPDDLRHKAFEQADILRWRGDNAEFLAEMRVKALQAGIPFDEYRMAVNTPVRTWDLGPRTTAAAKAS
jgi:hypothetical protein